VADDWSPQINMGVAVLIPEGYVEDLVDPTVACIVALSADLATEQEREGVCR
jgi:transcription-repair coupling factor (superfamily II helicase)